MTGILLTQELKDRLFWRRRKVFKSIERQQQYLEKTCQPPCHLVTLAPLHRSPELQLSSTAWSMVIIVIIFAIVIVTIVIVKINTMIIIKCRSLPGHPKLPCPQVHTCGQPCPASQATSSVACTVYNGDGLKRTMMTTMNHDNNILQESSPVQPVQ